MSPLIDFSLPRQWSRVWNWSRLYVCVCVWVCVCVSLCQCSDVWTAWATDLKFGMDIAFDNNLDEFEGQGHRWKVRVTILKNKIFGRFYGVPCVDCTEPFCYDIRRHDVLWRHGMTSWHHLMTFGQEYWQRGHFAGGCINAQAFSYINCNSKEYI